MMPHLERIFFGKGRASYSRDWSPKALEVRLTFLDKPHKRVPRLLNPRTLPLNIRRSLKSRAIKAKLMMMIVRKISWFREIMVAGCSLMCHSFWDQERSKYYQ